MYSVLCDFYKRVLLPLQLMFMLVTGVIPLAPLLTTCSFLCSDRLELPEQHSRGVRTQSASRAASKLRTFMISTGIEDVAAADDDVCISHFVSYELVGFSLISLPCTNYDLQLVAN